MTVELFQDGPNEFTVFVSTEPGPIDRSCLASLCVGCGPTRAAAISDAKRTVAHAQFELLHWTDTFPEARKE